MLVLTRKIDEVVVIGQNIRVVVLETYRDKVVLGFEAPPEITVHREEVLKRIKAGEPPRRRQPG